MEELKPCPFCGGEAMVITVTAGTDCRTGWVAGCKQPACRGSGPLFTTPYACKDLAIEAWNRRDYE